MKYLLQSVGVVLVGLALGACSSNVTAPLTFSSNSSTTDLPKATPVVSVEPALPAAPASSQSAYEPNDSPDKAAVLNYGVAGNAATISGQPQDVDWYKFEGKKGDKLEISVRTQNRFADSTLDSIAALYPPILNEYTNPLARNDDATPFGNDLGSQINYTLPSDSTYYLKVTSVRIILGYSDDRPSNTYDVIIKKLN